jgi:hypothetical protein
MHRGRIVAVRAATEWTEAELAAVAASGREDAR